MIEAGLSPLQALTIATGNAAALLKRTDRGVLRPGSRADLIVLAADPATDIAASELIVEVWQSGHATPGAVAIVLIRKESMSAPVLPRFAAMCFNRRQAIPGTDMESNKPCPICAEQNSEAAIKCRRCGSEMMPEPTPPPQRELIRWQYKILIAILITGAILLYNAPKSVPVAPSRTTSSAAHAAGPTRSVGPPPVLQASVPSSSSSPGFDVGTASVQAISPDAAQRIRSHCTKATAASGSADESLKACEHREIEAWDRVVLDREFPPHDPSLDRRCGEQPFPADSFVAYEACLRTGLKGR
jgi:hypothetical protein